MCVRVPCLTRSGVGRGGAQQSVMPPLQTLQLRAWLLHWSLYVFLNRDVKNGLDQLIELFLQPSYRHALQTTCPHLLRYLACAIVIARRRRDTLKELAQMLQQEAHTYHDPITDFVDSLAYRFDFDGAQTTLRACGHVLAIDVFLQPFKAEFAEQARLYLFETYCKIHRRIDLGYVWPPPLSFGRVRTCMHTYIYMRGHLACWRRSWA
jgi:translation initiation factor 3 subunit E